MERIKPTVERSDPRPTNAPASVRHFWSRRTEYARPDVRKSTVEPQARTQRAAAYAAWVATQPLRPRPSLAALRWADRHVLGGRRAYGQAWALLWDSIRTGRDLRRQAENRARAEALFPSLEAHIDDDLTDALADVLPAERLDAAAQGRRLSDFVGLARMRLDPKAVRAAPVSPREPPTSATPDEPIAPVAGARGSYEPPKPTANGTKVVVLKRSDLRELRREFWARHRRQPTDEEIAEWAARDRAAQG